MAANCLLVSLTNSDQLECARESLAAGKWTHRELAPLIMSIVWDQDTNFISVTCTQFSWIFPLKTKKEC